MARGAESRARDIERHHRGDKKKPATSKREAKVCHKSPSRVTLGIYMNNLKIWLLLDYAIVSDLVEQLACETTVPVLIKVPL